MGTEAAGPPVGSVSPVCTAAVTCSTSYRVTTARMVAQRSSSWLVERSNVSGFHGRPGLDTVPTREVAPVFISVTTCAHAQPTPGGTSSAAWHEREWAGCTKCHSDRGQIPLVCTARAARAWVSVSPCKSTRQQCFPCMYCTCTVLLSTIRHCN